jgi:predicted TIM-barrel fold metal-dependent hydrolase
MSREAIAIDAWATLITPEGVRLFPDDYVHIFKKYKSPMAQFEGQTIDEMVADMDASDVDRCVLSTFYHKEIAINSIEDVAACVRKYPDRFVGAGTVNVLQKPMDVVRAIEYQVKELDMRAIRLEPYMYGDGTIGLPPNDKHYWPVYVKCVELDVPVCVQVGHTGPTLPSECGRPIYLDEVALAFPELVIVGCHLGQPWHDEMMILAWKHDNIYIETSARLPRHWPPEFVEFTKGRGQDKVIWATDYPLLPFRRTLEELEQFDLPDEVYRKVVRDNAARVFKMD